MFLVRKYGLLEKERVKDSPSGDLEVEKKAF